MTSSLLLQLRRAKWDIALRWDVLTEAVNQRLFPSHRSIAVRRDDLTALDQSVEWLEQYIGQPHPELGKDGEICPFARPALYQDKITFVTYSHITRPKAGELGKIIAREGIVRVSHIEPETHSENLTTVLVMFPALNIAHADLVQAAYVDFRDMLNRRGVMLGAFFPGSEQPGHHNDDFHVYQAPFPIYVLRPMGIHDILFISTREALREYRDRYGARYETGGVRASTGLPEAYQEKLELFPDL